MTKAPLFALACTSLLACMSPALDQGVAQEDPATADGGPESGEPALSDAGLAEEPEPTLQALVNGADRYRTQLTNDGYLTQVIAVEAQAKAAAPTLANLSDSAESVLGSIQISEPIVFFNNRLDWESLPASMTGIYDENFALRAGPVASWLLPNMVSLTEFKSMPACESIDNGITLLPAGNSQFLYQAIDFCSQDGNELSTKCCNPYRYVVENLIANNSEELFFLDQSSVPTLSATENDSIKSLFRAALTSHSDFRLSYTDSPKLILDYNPQDLSQICSDKLGEGWRFINTDDVASLPTAYSTSLSSVYNRIVSDEAYKQQMSAAVGPGTLNLLFSQAGLLSFVEQSGTGPSDLPADRLKMVSLFDDLRFYEDDNDVVGTKVIDLEVWNNEPIEEEDPFNSGQTIEVSPDPYRSQSAIHLFSPEADRNNLSPSADHAQVYPSLRCIKIDQPKECGANEDLFYFKSAEASAGCGNSENLRSALGFPELYLKPSGQPAIEENIDPEGYCLDRNTVYNMSVSTDSVFSLSLRYADGTWRSHDLAIEEYPDTFVPQQIISLLYRCRN